SRTTPRGCTSRKPSRPSPRPDAAHADRQGAPSRLPRGGRSRRPRAADRAVHVARALARPAVLLPRRAARRPDPDRRDRADQGDRPLRPRAGGRADHLRDRGWSVRVPRGLQELNVQLSRLVEQLTVQLERSPTVAELAKAANVEEEEVLEALESGRAYSSLSLSAGSSLGDDEEIDPLETIGTEEHEYELSEDRAVLEPGFRVLDERERRILHLRFFEGLTQSQIAQQIGISQMHVSRLIRRSLEKIRDEIASEGLDEPPRRAATS